MKRTIWQHIKRRLLSFKYALNGLRYIIKTQTNMQIHILAAIIVVVLGIFLNISTTEWLILSIIIALVLISEIVNTAIEDIVNYISPDFNKKAGLIKDLGAAFVLLAALFAIFIGGIIFIPKIIFLFSQ